MTFGSIHSVLPILIGALGKLKWIPAHATMQAEYVDRQTVNRPSPELTPTLVLLPGLDGTDVFLRPLAAALAPKVNPVIVSYPDKGAITYSDVLEHVRAATEALSRFYVLGLSFSGPVAAMLAAENPSRIKGVILLATFAQPPRPGLRMLRPFCNPPMLWLWRMLRRAPLWLTRSRDDPLRQAKAETLGRVSAATLAVRARAVLDVDVREAIMSCFQPVHCITFTDDRVVPPKAALEVQRRAIYGSAGSVPGGHFTGCMNGVALGREVEEFISRVEATPRARVPSYVLSEYPALAAVFDC